MKKYKYTLGQIVYVGDVMENRFPIKKCIIRKRKTINDFPHYEVSEFQYKVFKRNDSESLDSQGIFSEEVYFPGLRNLPRDDNWIQEDILYDTNSEDNIETSECSKHGCEIVSEFLDDDIMNLEKLEIKEKIRVIKKTIKSTEEVLSYLEGEYKSLLQKLLDTI